MSCTTPTIDQALSGLVLLSNLSLGLGTIRFFVLSISLDYQRNTISVDLVSILEINPLIGIKYICSKFAEFSLLYLLFDKFCIISVLCLVY